MNLSVREALLGFSKEEIDSFFQENEATIAADPECKEIVVTLTFLEKPSFGFLQKVVNFSHAIIRMEVEMKYLFQPKELVELLREHLYQVNYDYRGIRERISDEYLESLESRVVFDFPYITFDIWDIASGRDQFIKYTKTLLSCIFPRLIYLEGKVRSHLDIYQVFEIQEIPYPWKHQSAKIFLTNFKKFIALLDEDKKISASKKLKVGDWISPAIIWEKDKKWDGRLNGFEQAEPPDCFKKEDVAERKINTLMTHSKMSEFDGILSWKELAVEAKKYGHTHLGITDLGNIHHFPSVERAAKEIGITPVYGVEIQVQWPVDVILNSETIPDDITFCFFDIETTGLMCFYEEIIEIAAVKVKDGIEVGSWQTLIKIDGSVPREVTLLTGITNEMLKAGKSPREALEEFVEFIQGTVLVAHNGIHFDFPFVNSMLKRLLMKPLTQTIIDTHQLAKFAYPNNKSFSLKGLSKKLSIEYDDSKAHRAWQDLFPLKALFFKIAEDIEEFSILESAQLRKLNERTNTEGLHKNQFPTYCCIYVKNQKGLKDLYKLVSDANTNNLLKRATVPISYLMKNRKNLVVVNSVTKSSIMEAVYQDDKESFMKYIKILDFVAIPPIADFLHLIDRGDSSQDCIEKSIQKLYSWSLEAGVRTMANSLSKYLHPWHQDQYAVLVNSKMVGGRSHYLCARKKPWLENEKKPSREKKFNSKVKTIGTGLVLPSYHLKTTNEVIKDFNFLNLSGIEKTKFFFKNQEKFLSLIESEIEVVKKTLEAPSLEGLDPKIKALCNQRLIELYGEKPGPFLIEQLEKEVNEIFKHRYQAIFWVSHLLVKQSVEDGYLVGSRGSVGSSFVAYLMGISAVNPLLPHYSCKKCCYLEICEDYVDSGFDLDEKSCPSCKELLHRDGQNIPFETFSGLDGNKIPDIDLNFSGEYQSRAHEFLKKLFRPEKVIRAGTIGTIASKTAFALTMSYLEAKEENCNSAKVEWYCNGLQSVKRTTGQHPGGVLVIPEGRDVYDFTPINFPADDRSSSWYTTHFEFEYLHNSLLKFDILGHDDPTFLRVVQKLTGVDPLSIPNIDPKILSIFSNSEELGLTGKYCEVGLPGTAGLPEFGTSMTREILAACSPRSFGDLIRISGISHGTNVWKGNIEYLISKKKISLNEVITCRDDIMNYLVRIGIKKSVAFETMESVRTGNRVPSKYMKLFSEASVPNWYIESANKMTYIFPKAHATAYVLMVWKIAFYKIYYPAEFYAAYFSIHVADFDLMTIVNNDSASIHARWTSIQKRLKSRIKAVKKGVNAKEKGRCSVYEVALEALSRGITFSPLTLNKSRASDFVVEGKVLIPAWSSVDGLGLVKAKFIEEEFERAGPFLDLKDFQKRTKPNKTVFESMQKIGTTI